DETVVLTLGAPTNATLGANTTHTVTIQDNDAQPGISITDVTVTEGSTANFIASISTASGLNVSFTWQTLDGSAAQPGDYTAQSSTTVTILAGATSITLPVTTIDNALNENTES